MAEVTPVPVQEVEPAPASGKKCIVIWFTIVLASARCIVMSHPYMQLIALRLRKLPCWAVVMSRPVVLNIVGHICVVSRDEQ